MHHNTQALEKHCSKTIKSNPFYPLHIIALTYLPTPTPTFTYTYLSTPTPTPTPTPIPPPPQHIGFGETLQDTQRVHWH